MVRAQRWAFGILLAGLLAGCDNSAPALSVSHKTENPPAFVARQGDQFSIENGNILMTLKPRTGGRISSLKYNGLELLQTLDVHNKGMWGSVLWSSPQNDWGWPPLKAHDIEPYAVTIDDDALVMTSDVDYLLGFQLIKSFNVLPGREAIRMLYTIVNRSDEDKVVAPWEVTRFKTGGLTLFPKGETGFESGIFYMLPVDVRDGVVWHAYDVEKLQQDHHKLMTDGQEGWLAYVNDGILIIKQFKDVPADEIAPGEGEIELFANAERTCMELQQQGSITTLKPGEKLEWEVLWHVSALPEHIKAEVGSKELVEHIRALVAETHITR